MRVFDLGYRLRPDYEEIEDRRTGGRSGGSRGSMMSGYEGGFYSHHGKMHEKMRELDEREMELEERERELEEMERMRHHKMGYAAYPMDTYGDDRYWGDDIEMRRGRKRGRMRSY